MRTFSMLACGIAGVVLFGMTAEAADPKPVIVQERADDMLWLVGNERLSGMVAGPPQNGVVTFYVRRAWLEKHQPALYRKAAAEEKGRDRRTLEQLRDRTAEWSQRRPEPRQLTEFIQRAHQGFSELVAAYDENAATKPKELLALDIPAVQVRKNYSQPADRRRLFALAWQHHLDEPEARSAETLTAELKERDVDPRQAEPDLSSLFGLLPLDDRQWAAKVALVEYKLTGKPVFQGTAGTLVRQDSGQQAPNLQDLFGGLLQGQLGGALDDLLNPGAGGGAGDQMTSAINKATREAAAEGLTGAKVLYLDQDLVRRSGTVRGRFLALMPDGSWATIWQTTATIDASKPRPEAEKALAEDPQVAGALGALKGLGLGGNEDLLQTALRFGAATQESLQEVERSFDDFLRKNSRRLDGPPLVVPSGNSGATRIAP